MPSYPNINNGTSSSGLVVYSGNLWVAGQIDQTTVNDAGYLNITNGGKASQTTINSGGRMTVYNSSFADYTTVNSGGTLFISSGGTAKNVDWTPCRGNVIVSEGASVSYVSQYSGVYYGPNSHGMTVELMTLDQLYVMSDGIANDIKGFRVNVWSGGIANRTEIRSDGGLHISFGGIANNTILASWGSMYVSSGGVANDTTVNIGQMFVSSGGYASKVALFGRSDRAEGDLYVSSGGLVESVTVEVFGDYYVLSGGTGIWTTINAEGNLEVSNGGFASQTVINGGNMIVSQGGTTNKTVVNGGSMIVSNGGTATEIVENGGYVMATPGKNVSFAPNTFSNLVISSSFATVHSGTTANQITIGSSGGLYVFNKGIINETEVDEDGILEVSSGGIANKTAVNGGKFDLYSGGVATSTTINNNGLFAIYSKGVANIVSVKSGGELSVSSGGSASDVKISRGAVLNFDVASETYLSGISSGSAFEMKEAFISDYTIASGGQVCVQDGGVAMNTTIIQGTLNVAAGGTANSLVQEQGQIVVSSGGKLTGVLVFADVDGAGVSATTGAILDFNLTQTSAGTTALVNNLSLVQGNPDYTITVNKKQETGIYNLANIAEEFEGEIMVKAITGEQLGVLTVGSSLDTDSRQYSLSLADGNLTLSCESMPTIDKVIESNQSVIIGQNDVYQNTVVSSNGQFIVSSGGTANGTTIKPGAKMYISSGGTATDIEWTPCEGHVYVKGGYATFVSQYSGVYYGSSNILLSHAPTMNSKVLDTYGEMNVMSGGTANGTTIVDFSSMFISSGVTVDNTKVDGGAFYVSSGAAANSTTVSRSGHMYISSGGTANSTTIIYGFLDIRSDGTANNTYVSSGGYFFASSGGIVNDTTVFGHGNLTVSLGGIVSNTKVNAGGTVELQTTAMMTGKMSFSTGAIILVENGSIINFDLTQVSAGEKALLNDWSLVQGTPDYTITVNEKQDTGIYKLAGVADEFDGVITVKGTDGESLGSFKVGESFEVGEDTYALRIDDESLVLSIAETHPADTVAPTISNIQASLAEPTNQDVVLTADFADDVELASSLYKIGENGEWINYEDGVTVKENGTVYFKAIDAAGNESEVVSYTVSNIDKVEPGNPSGLLAVVSDQTVALLWNVSTDDFSGVKEYLVTYSLNGQVFTARTANSNYVLNNADFGSYSWSVQAVDFAGNESALIAGDAFTVSGFKPYTVEYSADNFEHVIRFTLSSPTLDSFRMPTGTYQLRVRQEGSSEWMTGDSIVAAELDATPQLIKSDADGNADIFFATPIGTWESGYVAQHVGSIGDWTGTNEYTTLFGKNKLADIIEGSTDANILLMTDDDNGDTLFVDDIYTASPGNIAEKQSRIAQIDEIRAGAGNDIVDMTSQNFEYIGDGLTIRGGEGNDTIWANKGNNWLFGDAGNDRIVGASGDDVIAGGIGNDRMHGGGGKDTFTFCENWGVDNVEQLAAGEVVLWFAEGSLDKWDASKLTYTDGTNSVKVTGVTADKVALKFGDDGSDEYKALASAGAFFDATTERIFEEEGKGILASL